MRVFTKACCSISLYLANDFSMHLGGLCCRRRIDRMVCLLTATRSLNVVSVHNCPSARYVSRKPKNLPFGETCLPCIALEQRCLRAPPRGVWEINCHCFVRALHVRRFAQCVQRTWPLAKPQPDLLQCSKDF
jgi:hypothetical protein